MTFLIHELMLSNIGMMKKNNQDSSEFVTLKLNDLYAPNWMLYDDFLYSVLMNKKKALSLLNAKLNEVI